MPTPETTETQETQTEQGSNPSAPTDEQETPKTIPYERFKEVNEKARSLEARLSEIEKSQKAAQETALKEQNKYKELYEQRENDLKAERTRNMKLRIVTRLGVTGEDAEDLADRLKGETEEELTKDAEKFVSRFTKSATEPQTPTPPGVPPHKSGGQANLIDLATEKDPAKIREAIRKGQVK